MLEAAAIVAIARGFTRPNGEPNLSGYMESLIRRDIEGVAATEEIRAEIDRLQVLLGELQAIVHGPATGGEA